MNWPVFSVARFWAMVVKEFVQMRRDRVTFATIIAIPIMQLVLFGYAINTQPRNLPTAVMLQETSDVGRSILKALEIESKYIELRKPWQNLIEAQFKVQLRLADFKFEQARTVEEIQSLHAAFIETFNTTRHGAHQDRPDHRRTPVDVLGWVRGRAVDPERLRHLFGRVQFLRTVNPYGFVSIQRFYLYAEQGLSRQRVAVWIYEGQLRIEYRETLIARYRCAYDPRQKRLREVSHPMLYHTVFASPQLELIELDDAQWSKVQQRSFARRTQRITAIGEQLAFVGLRTAALSCLYLQVLEEVGRTCFPHVSCVM